MVIRESKERFWASVRVSKAACDTFINELVKVIQLGRFTIVIINDIMLLYNSGTAYYCIGKIARSLKNNRSLMF